MTPERERDKALANVFSPHKWFKVSWDLIGIPGQMEIRKKVNGKWRDVLTDVVTECEDLCLLCYLLSLMYQDFRVVKRPDGLWYTVTIKELYKKTGFKRDKQAKLLRRLEEAFGLIETASITYKGQSNIRIYRIKHDRLQAILAQDSDDLIASQAEIDHDAELRNWRKFSGDVHYQNDNNEQESMSRNRDDEQESMSRNRYNGCSKIATTDVVKSLHPTICNKEKRKKSNPITGGDSSNGDFLDDSVNTNTLNKKSVISDSEQSTTCRKTNGHHPDQDQEIKQTNGVHREKRPTPTTEKDREQKKEQDISDMAELLAATLKKKRKIFGNEKELLPTWRAELRFIREDIGEELFIEAIQWYADFVGTKEGASIKIPSAYSPSVFRAKMGNILDARERWQEKHKPSGTAGETTDDIVDRIMRKRFGDDYEKLDN